MRTDSQHVAPGNPRTRRRVTRTVLGAAVAVALGGSGLYIANANAAETPVAGRLQAEAYAAQSGAETQGTSDADGGKNVGWLANGDWLRYDGVTIGSSVSARIASDNPAGGSIELHLGSATGTLLTTIPVARTGGWQDWVTKTATVTPPAGPQTLFAVMKSAQGGDFLNINWFTLGGTATTRSSPCCKAAQPGPGSTCAVITVSTATICAAVFSLPSQLGRKSRRILVTYSRAEITRMPRSRLNTSTVT